MRSNIQESPEFFYSINSFCHHASISRGLFYKLCKAGKGPEVFKEPEGKKVFIPKEAAQKWFEENHMDLERYGYQE